MQVIELFNTSLVQLKGSALEHGDEGQAVFNTSLVQLKGPTPGQRRPLLAGFQYQLSAIEGVAWISDFIGPVVFSIPA